MNPQTEVRLSQGEATNESGMRGEEIEEMNLKKAAKLGLHAALCILTSLSLFNR